MSAEINASGMGGDAGGDWPKASIGNYKGVMLCNRPNEFGQQRRPERSGLEPFNSRVYPGEPLGWNPTLKLMPKVNKKKRDPNSILVRHRKFLKQLELKKGIEREEAMLNDAHNSQKVQNFKDQAARQRDKIKDLKNDELRKQNEEMVEQFQVPEVQYAKQSNLTQENLQRHETASSTAAPKPKAKKTKKGAKPAWAHTEKEQEEEKEAEIDDLLEFAYELDYEKYMEDYEVRQALAIIKDRVNEITKEDDWKEKLADEWNEANADEAAQIRKSRPKPDGETRSQVSYRSNATGMSKASYQSRVSEAKRAAAVNKQDWDASTTGEKKKMSTEDRIASKIANEVLKDNAKLRAVHSGNSIKHLLEREAKKQMAAKANGGNYEGPLISRIDERARKDHSDPSNLPYLHKNPAI